MKFPAKIAAIEFAANEVRLALVKTGGTLPTVLALHVASFEPVESGERFDAMVAAVERAIAALRVRPAAYVLCASSRNAVARTLRLSFRGHRKVAATVPFELEPFLAVPLEELSVDFATVREIEGETEVLAVGVRRAPLQEHVAVLRAAGVSVASIGLDVVGMTSLWHAGLRNVAGLHAVLHVREEGLSLAVVYGKSLALLRNLSCSATQMHQNPGMAAREVQNSLRAFQAQWTGEETVQDLCVTGIELFDDERQLFEEAVSVPVMYDVIFPKLKQASKNVAITAVPPGAVEDESAAHPRPRYAYWEAAIGTAFAAMNGGYYLDFAQGDLASSDMTKGILRHAVFSGALVVALLFGGIGYGYVDYRKTKAEIEQAGKQMWDLYADSFAESERQLKERPDGDIGGARTYDQFVAERDKHVRSTNVPDPETFSRPNLLAILADLAAAVPSGKVAISGVRLTGGMEPRMIVSGEIQDPAGFEQMLTTLRSSKVMTIDGEPVRAFKDGKSTFTINAKR